MRRPAGWLLVLPLSGCNMGSGPSESARDLFTRVQRGQCDKALDLLSAARRDDARAEMSRRGITACQTGQLAGLQGTRMKHHGLRRQDPREATVVLTVDNAGADETWLVDLVNESGRWKVDRWTRE